MEKLTESQKVIRTAHEKLVEIGYTEEQAEKILIIMLDVTSDTLKEMSEKIKKGELK